MYNYQVLKSKGVLWSVGDCQKCQRAVGIVWVYQGALESTGRCQGILESIEEHQVILGFVSEYQGLLQSIRKFWGTIESTREHQPALRCIRQQQGSLCITIPSPIKDALEQWPNFDKCQNRCILFNFVQLVVIDINEILRKCAIMQG